MKFRRACAYTLLCGLLCLAAAHLRGMQQSATPVPTANATVADFKGKVQVELPGQRASTPARGQILPAETVITTNDGRLLLRLEDGSNILVYSKTRLVLKQPSPGNWQRLQLALGKIKAEIQKLVGGAPSFQMGTPSAVISVRGTRFYVQVDKHNATKVSVEEGEVEVESTKGIGKPIRIKAGFSGRVKEDSAPEPPVQVPSSERQSGNTGNARDTTGDQRTNLPEPKRGKKP